LETLRVRVMSLPARLAQLGEASRLCTISKELSAWEALQLPIGEFVTDWAAQCGLAIIPLDDLSDPQIAQSFVNRLNNSAKESLKGTLDFHSHVASVVFNTLCETLKAIPPTRGGRNIDQSNVVDMILGACVPADAGKRKLVKPLEKALKCSRRWIVKGQDANAR
jgi:hypothetical protein